MDDFIMGELHDGVVRQWSDEEGWGIIDSEATTGGCWTHFSAVAAAGYRRLDVGAPVTLTVEAAEHDGFHWRAVQVWPAGVGAEPFGEPPPRAPVAYSSTLTITVDGKPVDPEPLLRRGRLQAAERRLAVLDALIRAADRRLEVVALIAQAEDADAARDRVADLLAVDDVGATAVLNLQLRRFSRLERDRLRDERDQTLAVVDELRP